jgi:hypothetical protein
VPNDQIESRQADVESKEAGETLRLAGSALLVTGHLGQLQLLKAKNRDTSLDFKGPCLLDSTPAKFICLSSCQVTSTASLLRITLSLQT